MVSDHDRYQANENDASDDLGPSRDVAGRQVVCVG